MRDTELYGQILGVKRPWRVSEVKLELEGGDVEVFVELGSEEALACPECGAASSRYDKRERRWRHLDTCQYRTILVAQVPRVQCSELAAKTIQVPWSEPGSSFTALFEALVIDWLRAATTQAVARHLGLSWDQADGVMQRAVRRGLARRRAAGLEADSGGNGVRDCFGFGFEDGLGKGSCSGVFVEEFACELVRKNRELLGRRETVCELDRAALREPFHPALNDRMEVTERDRD